MRLAFPVHMVTERDRRFQNVATTPNRKAIVVCLTWGAAADYGSGTPGFIKPEVVKVLDLESLRGILGIIVDRYSSIKWIYVIPHPGAHTAPARMRISTLMKVPKGKAN